MYNNECMRTICIIPVNICDIDNLHCPKTVLCVRWSQTTRASIAQWLEHWSCKPGVESSILSGGFNFWMFLSFLKSLYAQFHHRWSSINRVCLRHTRLTRAVWKTFFNHLPYFKQNAPPSVHCICAIVINIHFIQFLDSRYNYGLKNFQSPSGDWTHDPWFTRPVLYHWAMEAKPTSSR